MFLEEYESQSGSVDFMDFVDHTEGDMLDLSDDDGVVISVKTKQVEEIAPELLDNSQSAMVVAKPFMKVEVAEVKPKSVTPIVKVSKMDIARRIYAEEAAKGPIIRKNVIARFVSEAGCTTAGANTYFQNIHKK